MVAAAHNGADGLDMASPPLAGRAVLEAETRPSLAPTVPPASSPSSPSASPAAASLADEGVVVERRAIAPARAPMGLDLTVGGGLGYSLLAGLLRGGAHGLKLLLPIHHTADGAVGGSQVDVGLEEVRISDTGRFLTPAEDVVPATSS